MNRPFPPSRLFVLVVLSLLGGVTACTRASGAPPGESGAAVSTEGASVLLYADASEADSSCGCGKIIRRVRQARDRGVAVREVSVEKPGDVVKRYRLVVAPTVLVLDGKGEATARHEGEGDATIAALSVDLDRLEKRAKR